MNDNDIKILLKNRREELGLTMLEVSKAVGVSEATVSRWESGDIADMKRSRIVALAKVLEIHPMTILGEDKETEDIEPLSVMLGTQDELLISLVKKIVGSSEEERKLLKKIMELTNEQKDKLKILIESNIL